MYEINVCVPAIVLINISPAKSKHQPCKISPRLVTSTQAAMDWAQPKLLPYSCFRMIAWLLRDKTPLVVT